MSDGLTLRVRFNPKNWYWLADDGRLYAGATESLVQPDDPDYVAWLAVFPGRKAAEWPRDTSGNQTDASLQDLVGPYGMFASLRDYAAGARFLKETGGLNINGQTFPTDRDTQAKLTAAVVLAQVNPAATFTWKLADGTFTLPMTAQQLITVASTIGAYVNGLFAAEDAIGQQIKIGGMTTRTQVDTQLAAVVVP